MTSDELARLVGLVRGTSFDSLAFRRAILTLRIGQMTQPFHDHFSGVANRYADFRPRYPSALFDYLATLAPRNSVVWDCACGNGQASFDLAARFDRVVATDASQEQIASAKPHPKIEFRVASAEQSGLPGSSVGLVTVAQAVHWFNLEKFFAEAQRVLAPGGVIAVWAYGINTVEGEAVDGLVQDFYWNTVGPYWPPERKIVEGDGYRALPFPFAEITPPSFVMEVQWTCEQLLGYFSTWSATSRYIKAKGHDPVPLLATDLKRIWPDGQRRRVVWPLPLRVGRVD